MLKLYIKNNITGRVHEYGNNQHDALILGDDNALHYENLQDSCGTDFPKEGYSFVLENGKDPRTDPEYIRYGVEPYIDIGGYSEDPYPIGNIEYVPIDKENLKWLDDAIEDFKTINDKPNKKSKRVKLME